MGVLTYLFACHTLIWVTVYSARLGIKAVVLDIDLECTKQSDLGSGEVFRQRKAGQHAYTYMYLTWLYASFVMQKASINKTGTTYTVKEALILFSISDC